DVESGKKGNSALMANRGAHSVALSPDGKLLAVGGNGAELKLFDVVTGKTLATLEGHRASFTQVGFTPDGKYLVTSADDNMLRVWKVADRSPHANYRFTSGNRDRDGWKTYPEEPHERAKITITFEDKIKKRLYHFAISPDGKSMAVTTGTTQVK